MILNLTLSSIIGALVGCGTTYYVLRRRHQRWAKGLRRDTDRLIELEREKVTEVQQANENALNDMREDIEERKRAVEQYREKLKQEIAAESEIRREAVQRRNEAEEAAEEYRTKLRQLNNLSPESLVDEFREETRREVEDELRKLKLDILSKGEGEIDAEARRILIDVMQRMSARPNHDVSATIVPIAGEEMKGRLIGREGRNIKAFEQSTGVTLMIDETPDSVLISSFDPVRREVARRALEALLRDGRIHPASIEEYVDEADHDVAASITEYGEDALRRLQLGRIHPEIVTLLGRMRYRLSNNQNSLDHSLEVATLCGLLASELGLDPQLAKRAGLLHDIGKVMGEEYTGSHALVAASLLKRLNEDPLVVNAVAAHHEEVPAESPYAALVMMGDSISAMRPGARTGSMESYVQRVRKLEELAMEQQGVEEAYALQAGREVRVVVRPDRVDDHGARILARSLRNRIEEEMQYPGTIKVTVIREARFKETAR